MIGNVLLRKSLEGTKNESIESVLLSEYDCNELILLLLSLSPSLLWFLFLDIMNRDYKQSLDNQAITFLANGFITLASSLPHKSFLFFFLIPSGYSFVSLCLHCLLYHVSQLQNISLFLKTNLHSNHSVYATFSPTYSSPQLNVSLLFFKIHVQNAIPFFF